MTEDRRDLGLGELVRYYRSRTGLALVAGLALLGVAVILDGPLELLAVPGLLAVVAAVGVTVVGSRRRQVRMAETTVDRIRGLEARVEARLREVAASTGRVADEIRRSQATLDRSGQKIVDRVRDLEVRVTAETSTLKKDLVRERSDRSLVIAHATDPGLPVRRIVLQMSVHRSGSTWLFDLLRLHPSTRVEPTADVWRRLGLRGRRYPVAFSDVDGATIPLEVEPGVGAAIPPFETRLMSAPLASERWVLEKAHPQFIDFDAGRLVSAIETLRLDQTEVALVYGVRRPLDSMWSMAEFKRRDPKWYSQLDERDIPDFILRSLVVLEDLRSQLAGIVVDYDDIPGGESVRTVGRLLEPTWGEEELDQWLAVATRDTDRASRGQSSVSAFLGPRDAERGPDGPDGAWSDRGDIVVTADDMYRRLVTS